MTSETDSTAFVSFSDGTSLPNPISKVAIQGEVVREAPLDWFFSLRARVSSIGEVKSSNIIAPFFRLSEDQRRKLFQTLKTVRIHITDPRPYFGNVTGLEKHLPPGTSVAEFLKRLHREEWKAKIQAIARDYIASRMLRDSPAEQARIRYAAWECAKGVRLPGFGFASDIMDARNGHGTNSAFDLTPFRTTRSSIVGQVPPFLSQSGPVFHHVTDTIDHDRGYFIGAYAAHRALCNPHAFDPGNDSILPWIEDRRSELATLTNRHGMFELVRKPLAEFGSETSPRIQAADFAAGIARELWLRSSLVHLAGAFEYVTYNGRRISESEAEGHQHILDILPN